ncbi:MAG: hypothetical protein ACK5R0_05565, partial [Bacteroidota bacterium]
IKFRPVFLNRAIHLKILYYSSESRLGLCGFPTPPRLHSQTTILGLSTACRSVHACAPRQREN